MRMPAFLLSGFLFTYEAYAAQASRPPEPFALVRSLQVLQDKIATGDQAILEARPDLIRRISVNFRTAPVAVWEDARNRRALAAFLLNGGDRASVEAVGNARGLAGAPDTLLEGALAYVGGNFADAARAWADINPFDLPASLGAHVAFTKAALALREDPKKAIAALDVARLLSPGSLMEEAALRRELVLLRREAQTDRYLLLASQYLRRFGRSLYAGEVHGELAAAMPLLLYQRSTDNRLASILDQLPRAIAARIYLAAAGLAVTHADVARAEAWARIVQDIQGMDDLIRGRAALYLAAAAVNRMDYAAGHSWLKQAEPVPLSGADAQLRGAVAAVLALDPPPVPVMAGSETGQGGALQPTPNQEPPDKLVAQARGLLDGIDRLLREKQP